MYKHLIHDKRIYLDSILSLYNPYNKINLNTLPEKLIPVVAKASGISENALKSALFGFDSKPDTEDDQIIKSLDPFQKEIKKDLAEVISIQVLMVKVDILVSRGERTFRLSGLIEVPDNQDTNTEKKKEDKPNSQSEKADKPNKNSDKKEKSDKAPDKKSLRVVVLLENDVLE